MNLEDQGSNALSNSQERRAAAEAAYPGIREMIASYEAMSLPSCSRCGATDTARIGRGAVGRAIALAGCTRNFRIVMGNEPAGAYYCHACCRAFDAPGASCD